MDVRDMRLCCLLTHPGILCNFSFLRAIFVRHFDFKVIIQFLLRGFNNHIISFFEVY